MDTGLLKPTGLSGVTGMSFSMLFALRKGGVANFSADLLP